ncbi:unnamed protein product [Linum trigynum]|uniref:Uncharacterized protein n=1 Tax=Linum trigynum TaxID=586398 RepID=A0AAV2GAD8_9ROSI
MLLLPRREIFPNHSERLVFESARLVGSREGEKLQDFSWSASCLDSVMVGKEFVENREKIELRDSEAIGELGLRRPSLLSGQCYSSVCVPSGCTVSIYHSWLQRFRGQAALLLDKHPRDRDD